MRRTKFSGAAALLAACILLCLAAGAAWAACGNHTSPGSPAWMEKKTEDAMRDIRALTRDVDEAGTEMNAAKARGEHDDLLRQRARKVMELSRSFEDMAAKVEAELSRIEARAETSVNAAPVINARSRLAMYSEKVRAFKAQAAAILGE